MARRRGEMPTIGLIGDLLILLNEQKVSFETETALIDRLNEVELETGTVISPLIYARSDWKTNHSQTPLYENIEREGVRIR